MQRRKYPTASSRVRRDREPVPWKFALAAFTFGIVLAAGFFAAARFHFQSIDFGMDNSELRNRIEELRSKNRRLKLQKEVALSPAEIKQAARKMGLSVTTVRNLEAVGRPSAELASAPEKPSAGVELLEAAFRIASKAGPATAREKGKIVRTVDSEKIVPSEQKPAKPSDTEKAAAGRLRETVARK